VFDVDALRQTWNDNRGSMPEWRPTKAGSARYRAARARLSDHTAEELTDVVKRMAASDFCCGRTPRSTWVAGPDWFLKPGNITKVLEGNYDNRAPAVDVRKAPLDGEVGSGPNTARVVF
jgi:hypothetical protein